MFDENSSWNRLFSPSLEEYIVQKTSGKDLTSEEVEVLNMWIFKQQGILPYQYHHFYENGDTMIYPEHLHDLATIEQMYNNRLAKERHEEEGKRAAKSPDTNPLKKGFSNTSGSLGSNFYGKKFVYRNQ